MEKREQVKRFDRALIARNISHSRRLQGLSQTELARRAGVNLASVYRVEAGHSVHVSTLNKIAVGLDVVFEDILLDKGGPSEAVSFAIHRAVEAQWFTVEDRRRRLPENRIESYQSPSERSRLGALGFVPFFECPPLIIPPNGPGIVLLECFEMMEGPFNAAFYEDGALYVLEGKASGMVKGNNFELDQGDWIAFKTKELEKFGTAPGHAFAKLLWIGATRLKRTKKRL